MGEAERHYRDVLEADPGHAGALQHLGLLVQQRGDSDESVRLLRRASEVTPGDPRLLNNLGNALRSRGDHAGAIEAYRAAVASDARYVNGLYNLAGLLHDQAELSESESCYRRVVALDPGDVGAWMDLGMVLLDLDRGEDSLPCFERAVALRPEDPVCHHNFGTALRTVGDIDGAEAEFRDALHYQPDYSMAQVSLAAILEQRGDYQGAEELVRKALAADADAGRAWRLLGRVLLCQNRDKEALEALQRALRADAADVDGRIAIAEVLLNFNRAHEAVAVAEQILAEHPHHVAAHAVLCKAYLLLDRTSDAVAVCRRAIAEHGDVADLHTNLGLALRQQDDLPGAIDACRTAIRLEPEFAVAHNNLGVAYMDAGDLERARECFREALRLNPGMTSASLNMARARRFDDTDVAEIERIEGLVESAEQPHEDRINLHFALGKMLDDCKRYEQAFEHYCRGNEYKRRHVRFDPVHFRQWVAKIRDVCTAELLAAHAGRGDSSERPVFIVGMPRSGTTLVEQILASHPQVFGAGELKVVNETVIALEGRTGTAYPGLLASLDTAEIRWAAQRCLDTLHAIDANADRVTDKMPTNFFHLGLISVMLPRARIIHCRRDALDVCLSNFMQLFAEGHYYSYSLDDIATYYRGYDQIMAHWRDVLPIPMHEIQYEELVEDQERISRAMVDHLGLEWDDRCLAFHRTGRAVKTASNWQVRQPIYKSARKRWKNYEKHLVRLKSELNYEEDN